ncbi:DNA phosphorothioation-associated protein 4 [Streptodolium elevatio]
MADERFRRPAAHEDLLAALAAKDGPFAHMYEAMMFAAMLGMQRGQRTPFEKTEERINLSRVENRKFGDVLLALLAASDSPDDPEILSDDRLDDRIKIFEEYANTGLSYLQGELNASGGRDLTELVSGLVMEALTEPTNADKNLVSEILNAGDLAW